MASTGRTTERRIGTGAGLAIALAMGLGFAVSHVLGAAQERRTGPPPPARVQVNRTVPAVEPPNPEARFSARPTVEEIFAARVFAEPFVPVGGEPVEAETAALASAITSYRRAATGNLAPFEGFLRQHPTSPWQASVLANLGSVYWARGAFTRALEAWDGAWYTAKDIDTPEGRMIAAMGMAGALDALATLGKVDGLEARVAAVGSNAYGGSAGARIRRAVATLGQARAQPDLVIPSGSQAVELVHAALLQTAAAPALPFQGASAGQSLAEVESLARSQGLDLVGRVRPSGAVLPVPSIVHWRLGHWSAVVESREDRYLVLDPALGGRRWIARAALDDEASGYVLVSAGSAPDEWRTPTPDEAAAVLGHSCNPGGPGNDEPPCPNKEPGSCGGPSCDMPTFDIKPENAGLVMVDTPVGYVPARGPAIPFTLTYDYRQLAQPQVLAFTNLGPRWTLHWVSFAQEVPTWVNTFLSNESIPEHVAVYLRGGGEETYIAPASGTTYPRHWRSRAQLVRVSDTPIRYERQLADGSVEVFGQPDAAPAGSRRVFLTEVRDPQGQTLTLTYDAQYRIVAVTDALGQVSTMQYASSGDTRHLTGITDPFGRTATFTYTEAGQLASITDVGGLTSSFSYAPDDFILSMTTPYGVSTFRHETTDPVNHPFLQATDAVGGVRRVEYHYVTALVPSTVPGSTVPTGFEAWNVDLNQFVTLEWTPRAWAAGPGDPATATATRWFLNGWQGSFSQLVTTGVPQYVQRPTESRVWYAYPGQNRNAPEIVSGWSTTPSVVARVLDDGATQQTLTTVNDVGNVIERTDPVGRRTTSTYAANGMDLLEVRQTTGTANDLIASYGSYTNHQPGTVTDAAGQTTTLTYTPSGQLATSTNAKGETTTYAYDPSDRLTLVTGPVTGATTAYTYDGFNRIATTTTDEMTLTTTYDVFDRPTAVWYPDGTTEQTTYDRLDVATRTDRLGRTTRLVHDALRRLVSTQDPAGRTIEQVWCACGSLDGLVDANRQRTTWERDVLGRVTREVRADGTTDTLYTYDLAGRLKTMTDPKDQATTYTYALDDAVLSTVWTNAQIATPSVSYTYDPIYARVATMVDGIGTTAYTYHPAGQLGAGQVASVDGPLPDDTITYAYDQLGRATTRAINGAANTVTWAFDALGRATTETNLLGTFTYTYDGPTNRLATVTYSNGQTSTYSYLPANQERRLQTIHHRYPNAATLSKFDYTYDAVGNILTWQQQADSAAPTRWRYGYDRADQLIGAIQETTDPTPTILHEYAYGYDPAGNRLYEQIDTEVTAWTYTNLNRLQAQAGGGVLQIRGAVNEPATVTIQGVPAAVSAANAFQGGLPVVPGTNVFTVTATDASGNVATAQYEVDVTNAPKTYTYDANGNLTGDGTRTFEWDARNQLVAINVGTLRSELTYDGLQRRMRVVEKDNGVTQSDTNVVWCRDEICEERAADGVTVTRRALSRGEQRSGAARLFASDHLGSVTEVTDSSAALVSRYDLDPWGRRVVVAGTDATDVGFTGHDVHSSSGVLLAQYRAYDPELGRWLSSDPLGDVEGPNRFAYVRNRPLSMRDMLGLQAANAAEALLCITNPFDCAKVRGCAETAFNETVTKFGRQGRNDTSDAFRHCYWNCCMAQKIGVSEAKRFADAHENFPGNDPCERDMDFNNNDVGRRVGSSSPNGNCGELCKPKDLMCEKPKKCKP